VDLNKVKHYAHLDIAGTSMKKDGMTGRPTRTLIEFCNQLSKNNSF
jgi:leucyl aminopeptidase